MPGTVKTTRKRSGKGRGVLRASCNAGCGYHGRFTMAMMRVGLAGCGRAECHGRLVPDALEDVLELHAVGVVTDAELETHPEHWAYVRECDRIQRGRIGNGAHKWGEELRRDTAKTRDGRLSVDELALERVHAARAVERNRARHAALAAHAFGAVDPADKAAAAADMPF